MIFQHFFIQNLEGGCIINVCHSATILLGDVHGVVWVWMGKIHERACVARKAFQKRNATELLEGMVNMYAWERILILVNKFQFHCSMCYKLYNVYLR